MDWRWVFQWIPCAWYFPQLQPPPKANANEVPLLDGGENDDILYALGVFNFSVANTLSDINLMQNM